MTEAENDSEWGGAVRRPSLIIADDSATVRAALTSHLRNDFEIVGVAKDAGEAIALAEEHQPELALLDVEMPGGGAREAVKEIGRRSGATSIVILSANESHQGVVELLEAGAMAYVIKGASPVEIVRALVNSLEARKKLPPS